MPGLDLTADDNSITSPFSEETELSAPEQSVGTPSGLDLTADTEPPISATIEFSKDLDPAASRKELEKSAKTGLTPEAASMVPDGDWDDGPELAKAAPNTIQWASENPRNAAAIRLDRAKVARIEQNANELGWIARQNADLLSSVNSLIAGSLKFGGRAYAYSTALPNATYNLLDEAILGDKLPDAAVLDPDDLTRNKVVDWFTDNAEFFKSDMAKTGLKQALDEARATDSILQGPAHLTSWLSSQIASNSAQILAAVFTGPAAGSGIMFASTYGNQIDEAKKSGVTNAMAEVDAIANATLETVGNYIPLGKASKLGDAIAARFGKEQAAKSIAEAVKIAKNHIGGIIAAGAGEEMATEVGQATADLLTGVDPNAYNDLGWRIAQAGVVGGAMSGGVMAPGAVLKSMTKAVDKYQRQKNVQTYDTMMDATKETVMKAESPEAARALLQDRVIKGTNAEKLAIPLERFNTVLRENGMDPAQVAEELYISEGYARTTIGAEVVIPTANWLIKFSGTPVGDAIRKDFHFASDPLARTENEAKEDEDLESESDDAIEEEEVTEKEKTLDQEVKEKLTPMLEKAGYKSVAPQLTSLFSSWLGVRADRMKKSGKAMLADAGLEIGKFTGAEAATRLAGLNFNPQYPIDDAEFNVQKAFVKTITTPEFDANYRTVNGSLITPDLIQRDVVAEDPLHIHPTIGPAKSKAAKMFEEAVASHPGDTAQVVSGAPGTGASLLLKNPGNAKDAQRVNGPVGEVLFTDFKALDNIVQKALAAGKSFHFTQTLCLAVESAAQWHSTDVRHGEAIALPSDLLKEYILSVDVAHQMVKKYGKHPLVNITILRRVGNLFNEVPIEELERARYITDEVDFAHAYERSIKRVERILDDVQRETDRKRKRELEGNTSPYENRDKGKSLPEDGAGSTEASPQTPTVKQGSKATGALTPLGAFYTKNGRPIIDIFSEANFSTIVHELMHYFHHEASQDYTYLKELDPEILTDQQKKFLQDMDDLAKEMGAESFLGMNREQRERVARSFETYIQEGKAPSKKLQKAFHTFRLWMLAVYRSAFGNGTPINDSVRGIFDRMLATQEQLDSVLAETNPFGGNTFVSSFVGKTIAVDAKTKLDAKIKELIQDAETRVADKVATEFVKVFNEQEAPIREAVKIAVESEARSKPVHQAISMLQSLPDESKLPKILFTDETLAKLPKDIVSKDLHVGRVGADALAVQLGYPSMNKLIEDILASKPIDDYISQETDIRIREMGADYLKKSPALKDSMRELVRSEKLDAVYKEELDILRQEQVGTLKQVIRKVTSVPKASAAIKEQAALNILTIPVSDIDPNSFIKAERQAKAEAGKAVAKGDLELAFQCVEAARLHAQEFLAASKAKKQVQADKKLISFFNKFSMKKKAKKWDAGTIQAGVEVLKAFHAARENANPEHYLGMVAKYDRATYEIIRAEIGNISAKPSEKDLYDLPFSEYDRVIRVLKLLSGSAQTMLRAKVNGEEVHIEEGRQTVSEALDALLGPRKTSPLPDTRMAKVMRFVGAETVKLKMMETMMIEWDRGIKNGFFWRNFYLPVEQAITAYRIARTASMNRLAEKHNAMKKFKGTGPVDAASFLYDHRPYGHSRKDGESLTGGTGKVFDDVYDLMGHLIHAGNLSNLKKMLVGRGWADINQETGEVDTKAWDAFIKDCEMKGILTQEHMDMVQAIWDEFEANKPLIQKAFNMIHGFYFDEIEGRAFEFAGKKYHGGYVPVAFDNADPNNTAKLASRGGDTSDPLKEFIEKRADEDKTSFIMHPAKGLDGMGISRTQAEGVIICSLDTVMFQLDKQLRFAHIMPALADVCKLLNDDTNMRKMKDIQPGVENVFFNFLDGAIRQSIEIPPSEPSLWTRIARQVRSNTAFEVMFVNIPNTLQQIAGLAPTMVEMIPDKPGSVRGVVKTGKAVKDLSVGLAYGVADASLSVARKWDKVGVGRGHLKRAANALASGQMSHEDIIKLSPFMGTLDEQSHPDTEQMRLSFRRMGLLGRSRAKMLPFTYVTQTIAQNVINDITWGAAYAKALGTMSQEDAVLQADSAVRLTQGTPFAENVSQAEKGGPWYRLFAMYSRYFINQYNLVSLRMKTAGYKERTVDRLAARAFVWGFGVTVAATLGDAIINVARGQGVFGATDDDDDDTLDDAFRFFLASQVRYGTAMLGPGMRAAGTFGYAQILPALGIETKKRYGSTSRITVSPAISIVERGFNKLFSSKGEPSKMVEPVGNLLGAAGIPAAKVAAEIVQPFLK